MTGLAPAKINLTLRVGARRADGFHEIESLVARVALRDRLTLNPRDDQELTLICDDPSIPADESNLVLRVARLLADRIAQHGGTTSDRLTGVDIALEKHIPAGSGLGGGSSDAAATLRLLNVFWRVGLSRVELAEIGAELGSDVPLFMHAPVCLMRGRGEIVQDAGVRLGGWAVLVLPRIHAATPAVYRAFDEMAAEAESASTDRIHPSTSFHQPTIESVLQRAGSCEHLMPLLFNDLEAPAFKILPELGQLARDLARAAGGDVRMTGSGSAFFRLFDQRIAAEACAERIRRAGLPETILVQFDGE